MTSKTTNKFSPEVRARAVRRWRDSRSHGSGAARGLGRGLAHNLLDGNNIGPAEADQPCGDQTLHEENQAFRKTPRLRRRLVRMAKRPSAALSNDAEALERPAWMARQSSPHNGMLGGGVVVEDRVD